MDSMEDTIKNQEFLTIPKKSITLRDKFNLFVGLSLGILGTIGGWWMMLSFFGFQPTFPGPYTFLNLIIGMITIATFLTALLVGGPYLIRDAIKSYREKTKETFVYDT